MFFFTIEKDHRILWENPAYVAIVDHQNNFSLRNMHSWKFFLILQWEKCFYFTVGNFFIFQWENPVCDETISPACVAIVPGFPGCLEVVNIMMIIILKRHLRWM